MQGVGFRPHAYRLATELGIAGWVRNDLQGVIAELEGPTPLIEDFLARVVGEAPAPARIERISSRTGTPAGESGFRIVESVSDVPDGLPLPPDLATCSRCLEELRNPGDRRYRYPFVNCCACGPRLTIACGLPYDRAATTMSGFVMCDRCRGEYDDPFDRRFHAEPIACPACGPRAWLADRTGIEIEPGAGDADAVGVAAAMIRGGAILAIKGVGGFHLACRADDDRVVRALRGRKRRPHRPFAVMVADLAAARTLVRLDREARGAIEGPARPIVLAPSRSGAPISPSVAPGLDELGVMLPYSPLHHLLAVDSEVPLVMTSANRAGEPIVFENERAVELLGEIVDGFLLHDRPIATTAEDSVLRAASGRAGTISTVRRSRGFVPAPVRLPVPCAQPTLACGAELKSTICLARGDRAWVGPHLGDLGGIESIERFRGGIAHLESLLGIGPEVVVHDLHPDYGATRYALERKGVETLAVQHHHAHMAAVLAEHGEDGPAVGIVFDGAGLGADGTVWGGEVLTGDLRDCERACHLFEVPLPGGDAAAREPWRMACVWSAAALGTEEPGIPTSLRDAVDPVRWRAVARMAAGRIASPRTSSAGRLFDAVAALCGVRTMASYEGQAAVELEAICAGGTEGYRFDLLAGDDGSPTRIDPRGAIRSVLGDIGRGEHPSLVAARFHEGLARGAVSAAAAVADERGLERVALAGGVFHNRRLTGAVASGLRELGLRVLMPERLPAGDGAISLGQAAVAAARTAEG